MKRMGIIRWSFAAATAVSLVFGAAQAFAAAGPPDPWPYVCNPYDCQAMCGPGCGGTCINNDCYCDC